MSLDHEDDLMVAEACFRRGDPVPMDVAARLTVEGIDLAALEKTALGNTPVEDLWDNAMSFDRRFDVV